MDCPKGKGNALAGLPNEAMLEILARAPFRSVCRSKCVAKAWRDLIDDPLNRGRLPQTLQGFFSLFLTWCSCEHVFVKYPASSVPLDIDPCFSFLTTRLPETEWLSFLDSCNGLLLFGHYRKSDSLDELGYIVCNPTTKHWVTVPVCACYRTPQQFLESHTYLTFNPAVSSHFHLIEFWNGSCDDDLLSVHTYSSESGVWSHSQTDWNEHGQLKRYTYGQRTFVNGILHLMVSNQERDQIGAADVQGRISNQERDQIVAADVQGRISNQERYQIVAVDVQGRISNQEPDQIVAVDVQGRIKRTIKIPAAAQGRCSSYISQSQERLHYIDVDFDAHGYKVSIWVLEDFDTQEWVLKDIVSSLSLFGRIAAWEPKHWETNYDFVVIHPDRNVVFFVEQPKGLIAYDMDTKEVSVIAATVSGNLVGEMIPYIPYFSESPALTNKN